MFPPQLLTAQAEGKTQTKLSLITPNSKGLNTEGLDKKKKKEITYLSPHTITLLSLQSVNGPIQY